MLSSKEKCVLGAIFVNKYHLLMEYIILSLIIVVLLFVVSRLKKNAGVETNESSGLDGVRRENAKNREPIESRKELFSSKFTT